MVTKRSDEGRTIKVVEALYGKDGEGDDGGDEVETRVTHSMKEEMEEGER